MNGFLLDTNVVSELTKNRPHAPIVAFLTVTADLWLSAIVTHELELGIRLLPPGTRRDRLHLAVRDLLAGYDSRTLPVDSEVSRHAARLRARARRLGRTLHLGDALTAGTAVAHDLILVTRNIRDFAELDVELANPW